MEDGDPLGLSMGNFLDLFPGEDRAGCSPAIANMHAATDESGIGLPRFLPTPTGCEASHGVPHGDASHEGSAYVASACAEPAPASSLALSAVSTGVKLVVPNAVPVPASAPGSPCSAFQRAE